MTTDSTAASIVRIERLYLTNLDAAICAAFDCACFAGRRAITGNGRPCSEAERRRRLRRAIDRGQALLSLIGETVGA